MINSLQFTDTKITALMQSNLTGDRISDTNLKQTHAYELLEVNFPLMLAIQMSNFSLFTQLHWKFFGIA